MRTSTKRILSIVLSGIFFIGAVFVFTSPVQDEMKVINKKRAEVATKQNANSKNTQVFEQAKKLMANLQTVKTANTIALAIPDGEQAVAALRQLEAIARSSGVKFQSVSFKSVVPRSSPEPDLKKLSILEINMIVAGAYPNIKDFLKKIETTVRIANVKDMTYKPGLLRTTDDSFNITIEMYYQQ